MRISRLALGLFAFVLAASSHAATVKPGPILTTPDQVKAETQALALTKEPEIQAARTSAVKRYLASPLGGFEDGKKTVDAAVDEMLYAVTLIVANDPEAPAVVWSVTLPHGFGKRHLPGSRFGGDSPDRTYRSIAVDPAYRYEIRGKRSTDATAPIYFSAEVFPSPSLWGLPTLAVITSKDIDVAADGSFSIAVDSEPTAGRRNHLQLPPGAAQLLLRDTMPDWMHQIPSALSVKRLGEPVAARSREATIRHVVQQMDESVTESLKFFTAFWNRPVNSVTPYLRPQGWGFMAVNRFSIQDDEALLITLDSVSAEYFSIQTEDIWMRSIRYDTQISSLNNRQAKPNADGSITFVLSLKDPGIYNWISTGGLNDGIINARWELMIEPCEPNKDKAVREVRKLKLSDLNCLLAADVVPVTAAERRQQIAELKLAHEARLSR